MEKFSLWGIILLGIFPWEIVHQPSKLWSAGERHAIIIVLALPPRESCNDYMKQSISSFIILNSAVLRIRRNPLEKVKLLSTEKTCKPNNSVGSKKILPTHRDLHIECSKQFQWNLYFYVSGQSGSFWAVLKLLKNSNMKFK